MLELIGLIAVIYLAFKFLPDFLVFLIKMIVGLIVLILFLNVLAMLFPFLLIPLVLIV